MDGDKSTLSIASSARTSPYTKVRETTPSSSSWQGSHRYRFKCYSQRGLKIGEYLASNTFIAGGYKWAINLYPNGEKTQCNGYVSLYVRLKSEETDVCALSRLTLVDQSGEGKHKSCTVPGRRLGILAVNNCYRNIFPRERHYYELIFDGVGTVTYDNCFLAIVKHVAVELIHSVEAITAATASFQNMFDILDLYEAMLAVLPKIEAVFQSVPSLDIYSRATKTIDTLIILARKLFLSFEDTVLNEQSDTPLASGRVHSVTRYTMDYVARILRYRELLKDILVSVPTKSLGNSDEEQFLEAQARAPLEQHVTWIIISLKINLEGKSCHYKDSSLRYAFLLYNVDHIIQVISGSPKLLEMIGKDHLSKLNKDVADAAQNYISSTWDRVWYCLADNGSNQWFTFYSGVSGNVLKQKLKKFNKLFEEVCETQCTQLGPHIQLRSPS